MSDSAAERPARLPRFIWALGFVSLLADVSSELLHPLLPIFVVGTLGAPAILLGLIEGGADALVSLTKAWAGARSDRSPRRLSFVRWGYALPIAGKALIALAAAWPLALAGRLVDRLGKGLRSAPRDALLAETAPAARRGETFGLHRALDHSGALIGASLAAALAALGWPLPRIFLLASGVGFAAWLLTLRLREPARAAPTPTGPRPAFTPAYWRALAVLLVPALGQCGVAFVLLRLHDLGWPAWRVVLAYAGVYALAALTATPGGRLADARGRRAALALAWLAFALADLGFARPQAAGIWIPLVCYGVAVGVSEGAARAWLADLSPASRRGAGLGWSAGLIGGAQLGGGLLAGALWDGGGAALPFYVSAAFALAALALLPLARGDEKSVTAA